MGVQTFCEVHCSYEILSLLKLMERLFKFLYLLRGYRLLIYSIFVGALIYGEETVRLVF